MKPSVIVAIVAAGFSCMAVAERTCRIVFPERPADAPKFAYLHDGKESRRVTLPSMNFSEVIALRSGDLTLQLTPNEITDSKDIPPGAPRLGIAGTDGDFYILIRPDPMNAELHMQMIKVDAGTDGFKPGETLWFNFTGHRIFARMGESAVILEPEGREVSDSPVKESGHYRAEFEFQPQGKGKYRRITEQQWWHDTASRHVGFMVDAGGKLPKIFFYRDHRPPE